MPLEGLIQKKKICIYYVDDSATIYAKDLLYSDSFSLKTHMWKFQWKDNDNKPQTVIEILLHCTNVFRLIWNPISLTRRWRPLLL